MKYVPRLIAGSLLLAYAGARDAPAESWSQYGGEARVYQAARATQSLPMIDPSALWRVKVGPGRAGVVVDERAVYVTAALSAPDEGKRGYREAVIALDRASGREQWRVEYPETIHKGQESFQGDPFCPEATPAVVNGKIVTIGFGGTVQAIEAASGNVAWRRDAVREFDAPPVQFGFSASPLTVEGGLFVAVGGARGGLMSLDVDTGKVRWSVASGEVGYATPVWFDAGGESHVVFVTREAVIGVDSGGGEERWRFAMPEAGLTNVPTPVALGPGRLLIAGQGVKGGRLLRVGRASDGWKAEEVWHNRKLDFFYCNWTARGDSLLGCDGKLLLTVDLRDGMPQTRQRGFADSNVSVRGELAYVLHGDGLASVLKLAGLTPTELLDHARLIDGRCWAAPTLVDDLMIVRGGEEVACFRLGGSRRGEGNIPRADWPKLASGAADSAADDASNAAVERITEAFASKGLDVAMALYDEVDGTAPPVLTVSGYATLADLARQQGLGDLAKRFLSDAVAKYPDSDEAKRLLDRVGN